MRNSFLGLSHHRKMLCVAALFPLTLWAAEPSQFVSYAPGGAEVIVSQDGEDYLRFGAAVWGPNWAWTGIEGEPRGENGVTAGTLTSKVGTTTLRLDFRAARPASNRLELQYELKAEADADLTLFVAEVSPGKTFEGREVIIESADKRSTAPCPLGKRLLGEQISALRFTDVGGRQAVLRFEPPCEIAADGTARLVLAKDRIQAAAPRKLKVSVELPGAADWFASAADVPDEPDLASWYPWQATGQATNSVLSLADWLEKPAGKHGRIKRWRIAGESRETDGWPGMT